MSDIIEIKNNNLKNENLKNDKNELIQVKNVKRALLVGINYKGTSSALNGCINDVNNIKKELIKRGYEEKDIVVLTDETENKPTRNNILKEFLNLIISDATYLFFHYSGHGSYVWDVDGDEDDGKDECLIPIDYLESGVIVDDELKGILTCLSYDKHLFCLLDCCHSGTGMDLKYNLFQRYGSDRLSLMRSSKNTQTRGECIMISGCLDHQTSADAYIDSSFQGAMSSSFIKAVNKSEVKTYHELIDYMRKYLKSHRYQQIPTLSSGKRISLYKKYEF